jgi:hypothetical protein
MANTSERVRQLFFPLRTSVELFPDPESVAATARAKEAVVLYDRVVFEAGLFEIAITETGSFANWRSPDDLTEEELARSRQLPEPGTAFSVMMGKEPARGVPAPPEAMRPVLGGPLSRSYVAEWHSGVIDELRELNPEWAAYAVLWDQGEPMVELRQPIRETRRAIAEATREINMDAYIKRFAQEALARDAVVAAQMGAAFSVTSLFEPLLAGTGAELAPTGRVALDILVPDVGNLPWQAVAEYREHPGSEDARGKLHDFEERAMVAEPDDPLVFQREVFREISRDLFAVIADLEGSLTKDLADEAVKTGVSFIPVIGPFLGPGVSLAQAVAEEIQQRRTWYAAVMKLAVPRDEVE